MIFPLLKHSFRWCRMWGPATCSRSGVRLCLLRRNVGLHREKKIVAMA